MGVEEDDFREGEKLGCFGNRVNQKVRGEKNDFVD